MITTLSYKFKISADFMSMSQFLNKAIYIQ